MLHSKEYRAAPSNRYVKYLQPHTHNAQSQHSQAGRGHTGESSPYDRYQGWHGLGNDLSAEHLVTGLVVQQVIFLVNFRWK